MFKSVILFFAILNFYYSLHANSTQKLYYKTTDPNHSIEIRISDKQTDAILELGKIKIPFMCHKKLQLWTCVNDCQIGAITLDMSADNKSLLLLPYKLNYQSCDPKDKMKPLGITSTANEKYILQ